MQHPTVKPHELADWLGYRSAADFQNAARRLREIHGFPPKLPGRPVWSRQAVLKWIALKGGADEVAVLAGNAVPTLSIDFGDGSSLDYETLEKHYEAAR